MYVNTSDTNLFLIDYEFYYAMMTFYLLTLDVTFLEIQSNLETSKAISAPSEVLSFTFLLIK